MSSCKKSIAAAATAAAVCVVILLLKQLLVFAAADRHGLPDGQICWCGSLNLIPAFLFLSLKDDLFVVHPLAVQSNSWPRNNKYRPAVITGIHGSQAGVSLPRPSLP